MKRIVVIGGGVVGLSTAYNLLKTERPLQLTLLEKEPRVATHQTGNNSGVIHSGIYYKPGSAKAKNCFEGRQLLLEYAKEKKIPHEICGKIIVATKKSQVSNLLKIYERGLKNGLEGLKLLGPEETKEIEPHVKAVKSIWVPQSGIIDYVAYAQSLENDVQALGGEVLVGQKVTDITRSNSSIIVATRERRVFEADIVINCAGLQSDEIAEKVTSIDTRIIPFRGEYYKLKPSKSYLVKNLIYPVPDPSLPFLGVHFTRMINGGIEAGPNAVLALKKEGYSWRNLDLRDLKRTFTWPGFYKFAMQYLHIGIFELLRSLSKRMFLRSLRQLIPELKLGDIERHGAGVRAQAIDLRGKSLDDFKIVHDNMIVNVLNCPSPAATASLSIGKTIAAQVLKDENQDSSLSKGPLSFPTEPLA